MAFVDSPGKAMDVFAAKQAFKIAKEHALNILKKLQENEQVGVFKETNLLHDLKVDGMEKLWMCLL
ncbi:hypothetical protein C1H46_027784 [Malus baccata]|uniref:Uncharacterized protein n=1 Tax=Malus baccata TaxID=106549 RepID=A0A540LJJ9_MALBA|nr:hypothetical protein C1H46_027784 [Malus baccata]